MQPEIGKGEEGSCYGGLGTETQRWKILYFFGKNKNFWIFW